MRHLTFANPAFLWLLPLALFIVWSHLTRRRPAIRFSDVSLFAGPSGGRPRRALWGGALLRGLACAGIIVACAGPRVPDERTRLPADAIAVMMLMDVSDTMGGKVTWEPGTPEITRLEASQRSFKLFVVGGESPDGTRFESRSGDQIGLVAFASVPQTVCPLTLNHTVLLKVADEQTVKGGVDAGTNVGDAIAEGLIRLEGAKGTRTKVMILLSDGQHVQSKEGKDAGLWPRQAAQLAANLGYKIYTIDVGPDPDPAAPADDERREGRETLRVIAEMTGGKAFIATRGSDMLTAYKEIDSAERVAVETFQYRRYFEFYWWCGLATVVFLTLARILERTRWRTVP
ncbi:MAG: VWA domain-containing protein [Gemmataceae bacterium]